MSRTPADTNVAPRDQFQLALAVVLRRERDNLGLTLKDVCERTPSDLDSTTLCRFEQNSRRVSSGRLYEISLGLDIPMTTLVESSLSLIYTLSSNSVTVDLRRMAMLAEESLAPASAWARRMLAEVVQAEVEIRWSVITQLAAQCDTTPDLFLTHLRHHEVLAPSSEARSER